MAGMSDEQKAMLYLFEKPSEPLYMPRAGDTVIYRLPESNVVSWYFPTSLFPKSH